MDIQFGIQPNCSEVVYQICGINKDNDEEMDSHIKYREEREE